MRFHKSSRLCLAHLRRSRGGVAAIEFAFLGGILSMILLGVLDFGMGFWEQIQVGNAARAGAEYAQKYYAQNGFDATAISSAVTGSTSLSVQATPAPTQGCFCPNATGLVASACNNSCGGAPVGTYVTVGAQTSYSTIFSWPGISNPLTLSASATVRVN